MFGLADLLRPAMHLMLYAFDAMTKLLDPGWQAWPAGAADVRAVWHVRPGFRW